MSILIFSRHKRLSVLAGVGIAMAASIPAFSQVSPAPDQSNPGLLTPAPANIPLQEELKEQGKKVIPEKEAGEVNLDVPEPPSIVQLEGSSFHVDHISVEGHTLLDDSVIRPIVSQYENRDLTLNDLGQVVEKINEQYRKRGFLTTIAYIPPQDVTQGDVTIKVMEGRVGDISIAGNKFYRTGIIARYLDQGNDDPLNIPRLEKNLRRINRQGDFRVRATLSPNAAAGKTDIRLDVEERQPWQISPTFDNQGRPTIGTLRWGTEVTNRNLTGIGDRLSGRWIGAAGTQTVLGSYFVPLNRYGTELGTTFSFTRVDVDLPKVRDTNNIIGEAINFGVNIAQPLDREHVFVVDAGLNFRRVTTFINGDRDSSTQDDIRSMQFGLNFDKFDRWGRTFVRGQTTVGTTWFGGNRQFWKAETLANRIIRLPKNNFLIVRGYAQFSPDALPPAEQFQLGGAYSVRGYTEGLLIGDRGYQFSVEHRWPVPGLRKINPWLGDRIQGATFFDYGRTWLDNSNRRNAFRDEHSLAGIGLGVRARLTQYLQGFVDFGFGLVNRTEVEPNAQPTARIHFGVRSDLLPDDYRAWSKDEHKVRIASRYKPRHSELKKSEKQSEPAKPEPVKSEPGKSEPVKPATEQPMPEQTAPPPTGQETTPPTGK